MEAIQSQLKKLTAKVPDSMSLQRCSDRTLEPNDLMIQKKYASPQIRNLPEFHTWVKVLLMKVHVITGWTIPQGEMLTILVDQFGKKLMEDYFMLNVDEVEYAFRRTGTAIKDWGKSMNLSLIDEVLKPYVQERFELSRVEERVKPIEQKLHPEWYLDLLIAMNKQNTFKKNLKPPLKF